MTDHQPDRTKLPKHLQSAPWKPVTGSEKWEGGLYLFAIAWTSDDWNTDGYFLVSMVRQCSPRGKWRVGCPMISRPIKFEPSMEDFYLELQ
jgi:hypothetical protein